jgi:hypothetical protein
LAIRCAVGSKPKGKMILKSSVFICLHLTEAGLVSSTGKSCAISNPEEPVRQAIIRRKLLKGLADLIPGMSDGDEER